MKERAVKGVSILLFVAVVATATGLLWPRAEAPTIEGAILPQPKPLPVVALRDHHNKLITTADFRGRWYLISYGFTHCPDICPTMLSSLAQFQRQLEQQPRFRDLQVVFYTIDPQRDDSDKLAQYVSWFDSHFLGLRPDSKAQAEVFEQSLGMRAIVDPSEDPGLYQVAHGFRLYLIDDHARLRASLAPGRDRDGTRQYHADTLLADYLALRRWFANGE